MTCKIGCVYTVSCMQRKEWYGDRMIERIEWEKDIKRERGEKNDGISLYISTQIIIIIHLRNNNYIWFNQNIFMEIVFSIVKKSFQINKIKIIYIYFLIVIYIS